MDWTKSIKERGMPRITSRMTVIKEVQVNIARIQMKKKFASS